MIPRVNNVINRVILPIINKIVTNEEKKKKMEIIKQYIVILTLVII